MDEDKRLDLLSKLEKETLEIFPRLSQVAPTETSV